MKLKSLIGAASLSTIAAAMAVAALPAEASARDHGNRGDGSHQAQADNGRARSDAGASRQAAGNDARSSRSEGRQGNWTRPEGGARQPTAAAAGPRTFTPQQSQYAGRGERQSRGPQDRSVTRTAERSNAVTPNRTYGDQNRNRTYSDRTRNGGYSATNVARTTERYNGGRGYNGNRNGRYNGNGDRNGHYNGNNRHYQGNYNRWNNNWRNDHRYDWHDYRNSHRNVYHLGAYYSPYRDWSYRRLSVGFYLDSLFYSDRYWIDDPWQYRLPDAYGPYHWVRYYDDALLVDVYSGEVVDVIPDFFW